MSIGEATKLVWQALWGAVCGSLLCLVLLLGVRWMWDHQWTFVVALALSGFVGATAFLMLPEDRR